MGGTGGQPSPDFAYPPFPFSPSSSTAAQQQNLPYQYQQTEKELEHMHPPRSDSTHPNALFPNMESSPHKNIRRSYSVDVPTQNQGSSQTRQDHTSNTFFGGSSYASSFFRRVLFTTPILCLVWIPGVLALSLPDKHLKIASVELIWWSVWLSVSWLGWWIGLASGVLTPMFFKYIIGISLHPNFVQKWYNFLLPMKQVIQGAVWAAFTYIGFSVFVLRMSRDATTSAAYSLHLIVQALFGILLCSLALVGEKILIQVIAGYFHERSYKARIDEQKSVIHFITTLYSYSHDIGRADTLDRAYGGAKGPENSAKLLKSALKGVRNVAKTTTSIFGTVASEIAGEKILQPNSPSSMVLSALSSANKSRQLARRIYYSFVPIHHRQVLVLGDILHCFEGDEETAQEGFGYFDKDQNGDCSLEEIELTCLELHRERLALGASMRDIDSAVGKLDSILMFIWYTVSLLIIVALLDVSFQTLLASAGTLILGLSWLIGGTAQEILASIIFLFVKHPYDVSDRVDVEGVSYVVKEMHLLHTVFRQVDGKISQMPHSVLNTKTVINIRRSGPITETFTWDVNFSTTFPKIEQLRTKMIEFLKKERRDYTPCFDVNILDFEGQTKLTLSADIKYKSNWQNGAMKSQRRNKWICALKQILAEVEIYGPDDAGNPKAKAEPTLIQLVEPSTRTDAIPERSSKVDHSGVQPVELNNPENAMQNGEDEEAGLSLNYIALSRF